MALQRSSSFLHAFDVFQWLFGHILAYHVSIFGWISDISYASCTCHVNHAYYPSLRVVLAPHVSTFLPCFELILRIFWDCLGSIFILCDQIMLALHDYSSMHLPSFEFRGLFRALGAMFP